MIYINKVVLFLILGLLLIVVFIVSNCSAEITYIDNGWTLKEIDDSSLLGKDASVSYDSVDNRLDIVKKPSFDAAASLNSYDTSKIPITYYQKVYDIHGDYTLKLIPDKTTYLDMSSKDIYDYKLNNFINNAEYVCKVGFDTITYDGANNLIKLTGGSYDSPYTFQDIADAESRFNKIDDKTFNSSARIEVGDGLDSCFLVDNDCTVIFNDGCMSGNSQACIRVYDDSLCELGVLKNLVSNVTDDGCSIVCLETSYEYQRYFSGTGGNCSINVFGCSMKSINSKHMKIQTVINGYIMNCYIYGTIEDLYSINVYDTVLNGNDIGGEHAIGYCSNTNFDNIRITYFDEGIYFYSNNDNTVYNITINSFSSTRDFKMNAVTVPCFGYNVLFPNGRQSDFIRWLGSSGEEKLFLYYSFILDTMDDATVTVYDKNYTELYTGTGDIGYLWLNHSSWEEDRDDVGLYRTPYTLVIEREGYVTYNHSFNNSFNSMNFTIGLQAYNGYYSEGDQIYIGNSMGIVGVMGIFGVVFGIMAMRKRRRREDD